MSTTDACSSLELMDDCSIFDFSPGINEIIIPSPKAKPEEMKGDKQSTLISSTVFVLSVRMILDLSICRLFYATNLAACYNLSK
jgi:hypothetical protein